MVFRRVFAASQRLFSLLGTFIGNGPDRQLERNFKDQTLPRRHRAFVCICSGALHTHWLQGTACLSQAGLGPAVLGIVSSGTASGVGKSVNREVRRDTPRLPDFSSSWTSAHRYIFTTATHRSHFAKLQRARDSSLQGEGWQSMLDLSCSKPALPAPHCSLSLNTVSLFLVFCTLRAGLCLSLMVALRWL